MSLTGRCHPHVEDHGATLKAIDVLDHALVVDGRNDPFAGVCGGGWCGAALPLPYHERGGGGAVAAALALGRRRRVDGSAPAALALLPPAHRSKACVRRARTCTGSWSAICGVASPCRGGRCWCIMLL